VSLLPPSNVSTTFTRLSYFFELSFLSFFLSSYSLVSSLARFLSYTYLTTILRIPNLLFPCAFFRVWKSVTPQAFHKVSLFLFFLFKLCPISHSFVRSQSTVNLGLDALAFALTPPQLDFNMSSTITSSSIPPPESPFPIRPSPTSSTISETTPAEPTSDAPSHPISAKPLPVEFPLTSFASTPHNVACIAFVLGGIWSIGSLLVLANLFSTSNASWFIWSKNVGSVELPDQGWKSSLSSPQLGYYLASWSFFHLMEFVVTSMYNPGKLSVSCQFSFRCMCFS